jgi:hypothetical protein
MLPADGEVGNKVSSPDVSGDCAHDGMDVWGGRRALRCAVITATAAECLARLRKLLILTHSPRGRWESGAAGTRSI